MVHTNHEHKEGNDTQQSFNELPVIEDTASGQPQSALSDKQHTANNRGGAIFLLIVIVIVAVFVFLSSKDASYEPPVVDSVSSEAVNKVNEGTQPANPDAATPSTAVPANETTQSDYTLFIDTQAAERSIMVREVTFPQEGWLVIYSDNEGQPGVILSAYHIRAEALTKTDWTMPLITSLAPQATYHAVAHVSDGDDQFDYTSDTPFLTARGELVSVSFQTQ